MKMCISSPVTLGASFLLGVVTLGWWAVPLLAFLATLVGYGSARSALLAALAAYAALFSIAMFRGPTAQVAVILGRVLHVPWWTPALMTLLLPATLAWSSATLGAAVHHLWDGAHP